MKQKITINLTDESFEKLERVFDSAKNGFEEGYISISNVVNEMILNSDIDIKVLQSKCIDIKKSLLKYAGQQNPDLDTLIKNLQELRGKSTKRSPKTNSKSEPEVLNDSKGK